MIRLVNIKRDPIPSGGIYIGRENHWLGLAGSKWQNPFPMKRESERPSVLEQYRQHIESRPDLIAALPELKDQTLCCYCFPKRCHGNVLIDLYVKYVDPDYVEPGSLFPNTPNGNT